MHGELLEDEDAFAAPTAAAGSNNIRLNLSMKSKKVFFFLKVKELSKLVVRTREHWYHATL